jgi:hypothetical protein
MYPLLPAMIAVCLAHQRRSVVRWKLDFLEIVRVSSGDVASSQKFPALLAWDFESPISTYLALSTDS